MVDQILELRRIRIYLGHCVTYMDVRGGIVGMPRALNIGEVGEIPNAEIYLLLLASSVVEFFAKVLRVLFEEIESVVVDGNGGQVAHERLVLDEFELVKEHVETGELAPPSFRYMRPVAFPRSDAVRAHIFVVVHSRVRTDFSGLGATSFTLNRAL